MLPRGVLGLFCSVHPSPPPGDWASGRSSQSSGDRHNPAMGFEENRPLSQLYILKFSQNFSELRLSKLLVLMGRFFMFWGRKQATTPECFMSAIRISSM